MLIVWERQLLAVHGVHAVVHCWKHLLHLLLLLLLMLFLHIDACKLSHRLELHVIRLWHVQLLMLSHLLSCLVHGRLLRPPHVLLLRVHRVHGLRSILSHKIHLLVLLWHDLLLLLAQDGRRLSHHLLLSNLLRCLHEHLRSVHRLHGHLVHLMLLLMVHIRLLLHWLRLLVLVVRLLLRLHDSDTLMLRSWLRHVRGRHLLHHLLLRRWLRTGQVDSRRSNHELVRDLLLVELALVLVDVCAALHHVGRRLQHLIRGHVFVQIKLLRLLLRRCNHLVRCRV